MSTRFITESKSSWQRLEDLLAELDRSSLRKLTRDEVRELGKIYRRTASDLAIARAESRDPRLINYLNNLVIRAHGRIYRAESGGPVQILKFFQYTFPQLVRQYAGYIGIAFLVVVVFGAIGYFGTMHDADFADLAGVPQVMRDVVRNHVHWWERLNGENQVGSSGIMTNNIQVMFLAFAFGAVFGVGTLYILASNGLQIGAVIALTAREGYSTALLTFMAGHGVIEMTCIFIAGGAGLLVGKSILMPGDLSRTDSIKSGGRDAVKLIAGCVPLLVIAGTIEGFLSPAAINPVYKFSVAILTGIALYSYLILAGRHQKLPIVQN
jgi:uncharacterized membrane protein SpoIIM required for sporulation